MVTKRNWLKEGCPKCGRKCLPSKHERDRGWCSSCEVASWSAEKKGAFRKVLSNFVKGDKPALEKSVEEVIKLSGAGADHE